LTVFDTQSSGVIGRNVEVSLSQRCPPVIERDDRRVAVEFLVEVVVLQARLALRDGSVLIVGCLCERGRGADRHEGVGLFAREVAAPALPASLVMCGQSELRS